jgi:hypothetical protein
VYFVKTTTGEKRVVGDLPLTATEALAFIENAIKSNWAVEIRDCSGNAVPVGRLRKEAGQKI